MSGASMCLRGSPATEPLASLCRQNCHEFNEHDINYCTYYVHRWMLLVIQSN